MSGDNCDSSTLALSNASQILRLFVGAHSAQFAADSRGDARLPAARSSNEPRAASCESARAKARLLARIVAFSVYSKRIIAARNGRRRADEIMESARAHKPSADASAKGRRGGAKLELCEWRRLLAVKPSPTLVARFHLRARVSKELWRRRARAESAMPTAAAAVAATATTAAAATAATVASTANCIAASGRRRERCKAAEARRNDARSPRFVSGAVRRSRREAPNIAATDRKRASGRRCIKAKISTNQKRPYFPILRP